MLDRTGDNSGNRWRGRVVNVMDPKQQGRIQVRVFSLHDNQSLIPDSDLPWASVVMPINSGASYRGVGGSPVGVVPGTIVEGYFADSERTILRATGISPSAGRTQAGQTIDGSYALDSSYNDVANAARGSDLNAALGLKNFPAVSQIGAVFPAVSAGIGSLATHTGNILNLMNTVDPSNMSGALAGAVTGFTKNQALAQLTILSSALGGMSGVAQALSLVRSGVMDIAALPMSLQTLVSNFPGGIGPLISLASNLSTLNPTALLGMATGGLLQQALGLASNISASFSSALNEFTGNLSVVSKQRQFVLEAAAPTPPPVPDPPTTTSSKAATQPTKKAGATDPWAMTETYDILPVAVNANQIDENLKPVTSEEVLGKTVQTETINSEVENENIMKQIGKNSETQQAAAADVRSMNESKLSPKEKAAAVREIKSSGGVF